MCLFVLTKGDSTPFNASSILEEDIVEVCIWFGHTHPEEVLLYSAIQSVMLFHTMDELQITAHGFMKTLMLCSEAIKVRTSPPSATHMRVYMAAVNWGPSGTQPPPSYREEEPHFPLATPSQVGGPHNNCKQT